MTQRLDHKLDCPECGTVSLEIPPDATETTEIRCSKCGAVLGVFATLQHTPGSPGANDGHEDGPEL